MELNEPPKKTVKLAPALVWSSAHGWQLTSLYESKEDVMDDYTTDEGFTECIWPAIPNKDGFFEIDEKE